jgi:hypothetical protein
VVQCPRKRRTRPGSGLRFAAAHAKSSPMRSETEAKRPVVACGKPFQQHTERVTALRTSGEPDLPVLSEEQHTAEGPGNRRNGPYGTLEQHGSRNALLASSAKHSLFQNRASCMRPACASFSTATTLIELSCLCEALPAERYIPSLHRYSMGMMKHRTSARCVGLFQLHFRKTR